MPSIRLRFLRAAPILVGAWALLAAGPAALAQPGIGAQARTFKIGGPDELWDLTMKMEMPGMPMAMPAQTHQLCLKKDRKGEDGIPQQDNCTTKDVKTVGSKTTFTIVCTGDEPMTGRGEINSTPTAYDGRMEIKGTRRGSDMNMIQTFAGKKVGACTDESAKMVASAQATGAAEIAKVCVEMTDKLYYQAFFDKGAVCETRKQAFCDTVGGMSRDLREPAAFKTVLARTSMDAMQGSFRGCNVDFAATSAAACGKATAAKDWQFVGNGACDDDVRTAGATYCKGRDYYLVDKSLTWLCNRYARVTRGPGMAAGGAGSMPAAAPAAQAQAPTAAPAEPAKADPMKQGVDALRKLLPF